MVETSGCLSVMWWVEYVSAYCECKLSFIHNVGPLPSVTFSGSGDRWIIDVTENLNAMSLFSFES